MMKKAMIAVVGLVLLAAACRRREYISARGDKVEVDRDGNSVKVTTKDGTAVYAAGSGTVLPADFPKDVPIYPDAKVTGSVSGGQKAASGQMVTFESPDSPDKIVDFYNSKLSGWKNSMEM